MKKESRLTRIDSPPVSKRRRRGMTLVELPAVRKRQARGLTLVELLATLAIVGLLSAAAMRVTAALVRTQRLDRRQAAARWQAPALDALLRVDLAHASRYRKMSDGFELRTTGQFDPETLRLRHLPAVVAYQVRQIDSRSWLVRRQESGVRARLTELICADVAMIDLSAAADGAEIPAGQWRALPEAVTIAIAFTDPGRPALAFEYLNR